MYAIIKPIKNHDLLHLQLSKEIFICDARGNPMLFDSQLGADKYRAEHHTGGMVIQLVIISDLADKY